MDGVLIDTEPIWEQVRSEFAVRHGGVWTADLQRRMMGARTEDWSMALSELTKREVTAAAAADEVISELAVAYRDRLPIIDGAVGCVQTLSATFRLGLVSGSPRRLIDLVLELAGLTGCFNVAMAADDVARGKPAPDPYIELARRVGLDPDVCAAVEDSANGIQSAAAAGCHTIAIPRGVHRPNAQVLSLAERVLTQISELTPSLLGSLG